MLQEYPSGVYQPGPTSSDPKIHIIQPSLYISDSPFSSSEILTLYLLLLPSGTPMNITIIYFPISYILYISQVPSTSPITDKFRMDTCRDIYVLAIYNEDSSLVSYAFQLIRDKQKRVISSSLMLTLSRRYPYALNSI